MCFFLKDLNKKKVSLLFDTIRNNTNRAGINFVYRGGIRNLNDAERELERFVTSRFFGLIPTYLFDIEIKPELLLGSPTVIRRILFSLGCCPPAYITIDLLSEGKIHGIKRRNLVERLNMTENLLVKILDELGLLPFLESETYCSYIVWEVSSSYAEIRSLNYWSKHLKQLVANKLFPLPEEYVNEKYMKKYVFSNGDILVDILPRCLAREFQDKSATRIFPLRFLTIFPTQIEKESILRNFLVNLDEFLAAALTILDLEALSKKLGEKIGEVERNFDDIADRIPNKEKVPDVFNKIGTVEVNLWELRKECSTFVEKRNYVAEFVKARKLHADVMEAIKEIEGEHWGFVHELESTLENILAVLASETSIIDSRFKNLDSEFNSLKTMLSTSIQIELGKRNLSIQNALGLLQIIAVVIFSFEIIRYFYPFAYDLQHVLAYILATTFPSAIAYLVYRKITSTETRT